MRRTVGRDGPRPVEEATAYPAGQLLSLAQLQQFGRSTPLHDGGWPWLPPHLRGLLERVLLVRSGRSFVGSLKNLKEFEAQCIGAMAVT